MDTEWDFIVIGAGSAGCAAASELSAGARHRVLVLEAGGADRHPLLRLPAGIAVSNTVTRLFDWGYHSQPDPTRNLRVDHWLRGRVVGGSSSINGMMYVRGGRADFDRWAATSNSPDWAADKIMAHYKELEHVVAQSAAARGTTGPIHVRTVKRPHRMTRAFLEAAHLCGHPLVGDYNAASQEGIAYAQLTQHRGLRWSSADAFLRPALKRPNLTLVTRARVLKLELQGAKVTHVLYDRQGVACRASARRVVLCAGAINSPHLLLLSGIGDAGTLLERGVSVKVHLPGVGRNLQEHPLIKVTYQMRLPTWNPGHGVMPRWRALWEYIVHREGPLASIFEATGFLRTSADLVDPDIQLHFLPAGVKGLSEDGPFVLRMPSVTILINKSHPMSRGEVRLGGSDPTQAPVIDSRLLSDPQDVDTLVRGIEVVRRIMRSPPVAALAEQELRPGCIKGAESLNDYVRDNAEIAFHPAGTCRMGYDAQAVTGPDLRVRGVENLWIADASVMPDLISGNTNAACMMIGFKLGRALSSCKE